MQSKVYQWLRAHRKAVFGHGLVLSAFLIFCTFFSPPLFDRLEAIQGESHTHDIVLPAETGNITYCLTDVEIGSQITEVHGWAFIEGQSTEDIKTCVVLESDDVCYVFDTITQVRPDVTAAYGSSLDLDLGQSGFMCNLPTRKIAVGEYILGIYIAKDGIEAFQRTDFLLTRSDGAIELSTRHRQ
jgi:hypothetical protein